MSKKEETNIVVLTPDRLAVFTEFLPEEDTFSKIYPPSINFITQDKTETVKQDGKKVVNIINEAGTFLLKRKTEETDEEGKAVYAVEDLGKEIEVLIFAERKQLVMYEAGKKEGEKGIYTKTPEYDSSEEILPLICNKEVIAKGTPEELQARYMTKTTLKGKPKSALENYRVLYCLYKGEMFTLSFHGSSYWSYLNYKKAVPMPVQFITHITSEENSSGEVCWNSAVFTKLRGVTEDEITLAIQSVTALKEGIATEKEFYAKGDNGAQKDFDTITEESLTPIDDIKF